MAPPKPLVEHVNRGDAANTTPGRPSRTRPPPAGTACCPAPEGTNPGEHVCRRAPRHAPRTEPGALGPCCPLFSGAHGEAATLLRRPRSPRSSGPRFRGEEPEGKVGCDDGQDEVPGGSRLVWRARWPPPRRAPRLGGLLRV